MLRRSLRLLESGYYTGEGAPTVSYKENLYRVFRRKKSHGCGPHCMDSIDHPESMGHHESIENNLHFADNQDNHESTRNTSNNWDTRITNARTIGTQGTQANHTQSTGTQATLKVSTGIQTIRARRKVRETFSFSSKIITGFLVLLLLVIGITHNTLLSRQMTVVKQKAHLLRQQMEMFLPLADTIPNFALESQGARILHDFSSDTYFPQEEIETLWDRICYWFYISKARRRVIQGHSPLQPAQCWAFSGERGHLLVSLSHPVSITHVTIGHITKSQSPNGYITSAPREFSIYGMNKKDAEGILLGRLTYDQDGPAYQTFKLPNPDKGVIRYVKLQIESNWGNKEYTCLYSFRVHRKLPA